MCRRRPRKSEGGSGRSGGTQVGTPSFKYNFLDLISQEQPALDPRRYPWSLMAVRPVE